MSDIQPSISSDSSRPTSLYYRYSGRTPLRTLIVALVLGLLAATLGGIAYAAAEVLIGIIYFNFIFAGIFGVTLSYFPATILRWGHVRNRFTSWIVVSLVSLLGFYSAWVAWIWWQLPHSANRISFGTLMMHPDVIWIIVRATDEQGAWSLFTEFSTTRVNGPVLWAIWLAEAAIILGAAWFAASQVITGEPFCEECGVWCGSGRRLGTIPMRDINDIRHRLESGDFISVGPLRPHSPHQDQWLAFYHHTCPSCGQLNTLSVKLARNVITRQGQEKIRVKTIIDKLLLHPGEAEQLLPPPPAPSTESAAEPGASV